MTGLAAGCLAVWGSGVPALADPSTAPSTIFVTPQPGGGTGRMVSGPELLKALRVMGYDTALCASGCSVTLQLADGTQMAAGRFKADGTTPGSTPGFAPEELAGASLLVGSGPTSYRLPARLAPDDGLKPTPPDRVDIPLTGYVNAFIGTKISETGSGHSGNNNPGAQTPFGVVSFGPDTPGSRSGWGYGSGGYYYDDSTIDFFSTTHLNGPGCRGQSMVAIRPWGDADRLTFKHADESASPGYYKVAMSNQTAIELTATTRTGLARITYGAGADPVLVIDARKSNTNKSGLPAAMVSIALDKTGAVSGKTLEGPFCGGTWRQPVYFYARFDTKLLDTGTGVKDGVATLKFDLSGGDRTVRLRVGISSVSVENARQNLEAENAGYGFDDIKAYAGREWNRRLNAIQIDIAKPDALAALPDAQKALALTDLTKFYTALYRTMGGPTAYSDVNGAFRSMAQRNLNQPTSEVPNRVTANTAGYPFTIDGKTARYGTQYSGFSMWDTYRSLAQLQAWVFPRETSETMQSLVVWGRQCGAFPHWVDGSEDTTPMNGDHAPNVIAGAYLFGARAFDVEGARALMKRSAFSTASACNDKASLVGGSLADYLKLGYIPSPDWTSTTLEAVTTDASIAAFLAALPSAAADKAEIDALRLRAQNWKNIFDPKTLTLRGKTADGSWTSGSFHESTEPNYFWSFAQDWTALIDTAGGKSAAITRLNALFSLTTGQPETGPEPSGQDLNGGEGSSKFYIGNEPAFQTPWAYNWAGSPKRAQYILPILIRKNFSTNPAGLPGNDDFGATSGWYIWATLGLYPVIPSAPGLAMSTPQFSGMTVWLGNGKALRIETDKQAMLDKTPYIKSVTLNGKAYSGSWLPLAKIGDGGTLSYVLSDKPTDWASDPGLTPPSGPGADYTQPTAPVAP